MNMLRCYERTTGRRNQAESDDIAAVNDVVVAVGISGPSDMDGVQNNPDPSSA